MAEEDVTIRITTPYDGSGLKQAIADKEKLEQSGNAPGASPSKVVEDAERKLRALKAEADGYNSSGATAAGAGAMRKYNLALNQDRRLQKEIIGGSQEEANAARAAGTPDLALEKEIELRKESLKVQKELNVYESAAIPIAQQRIDARKKAEATPPEPPPPPAPTPPPPPAPPQQPPAPAPAPPQQPAPPAPPAPPALPPGALHNILNPQQRQLFGAGLHGFDNAAGMPLGGVISGLLANPAVLAATLGGLVVGGAAKDWMAARDTRAQNKETELFDRNRSNQISSGLFGDNQGDRSHEAANIRNQKKKELDDALAAQGTKQEEGFTDKAIHFWNTAKDSGLLKLMGASGALAEKLPDKETSVAKKERELKEQIERLQKGMPEFEKQANEEAMKGPAGNEMARIKAKLAGDMQGAREASFKAFMEAKKGEAKDLGLTGEFNDRYVEAAAREKLRDQYMAAGAKLVNARSGNADVLRAAQIATGQFGGAGGGRIEALIEKMTNHMNQNHEEAKRHMPKSFGLVKNLRGE